MEDSIERHVLSEVVHPSSSSTFLNQVVLDNLLSPVPGCGVREVNHAELDGDTINEVSLVSGILDEVAIGVTLRELVLSNTFSASQIGDVRVDVNEGTNSILGPVVNHAVPLRVLLSVKLPVPEQSHSLLELLLTDPVLHPQANHGQAKRLHERVFLIYELLPSHNSNDATLSQPLWKWLHEAHSGGNQLS